MYCEKCGNQIDASDLFCQKCGFRLNSKDYVPSELQQQPADPWNNKEYAPDPWENNNVNLNSPEVQQMLMNQQPNSNIRVRRRFRKKSSTAAIVFVLVLGFYLTKNVMSSFNTTKEIKPEPYTYVEEDADYISPNKIEPTVLFDKDGIKITAQEMVYQKNYGETIILNIKNNTDQNIDIICDASIVNGTEISNNMYKTINKNTEANVPVSFEKYELEDAGIVNINNLKFYFNIYDSETYEDIIPEAYGELDTLNKEKDPENIISGQELLNKNGIRILYVGYDENYLIGESLKIYIENNSDTSYYVDCDNIIVDRKTIDTISFTKIKPGTRKFGNISILKSDMEINNIETIKNPDVTFRISTEDYLSEFKYGPITIKTN